MEGNVRRKKKFKPCLSEKVRCNAGHAAQFINVNEKLPANKFRLTKYKKKTI